MKTKQKTRGKKEWTPNGKELEIIEMPRIIGKKGPKVIHSKGNIGEAIIKALKESYIASIKVFGKTFTAKGSTVKEAIENLSVGKLNKGVSVIEIIHNGKSQSKILPSVQTARLFSPSPLTREIAIKNVSLRFYGV